MKRYALCGAVLLALVGCTTPPRIGYSWGNYEESIYAAYREPQDMPVERQVEVLEKDYQQTRAANGRVPPGWHAHLGYLYYQLGKLDQARQELITEKSQFPESTPFMDRLLANLGTP